jgi:aminoglycoside phosphotransferase (APT) family kinase protein
MAAGNEALDTVAVIAGERLRVERAVTGECRLPVLGRGDDWRSPAELVALTGDACAHIAAPVNRLAENPTLNLHLLVVDEPGPVHSWLRLADLDQLNEPAVVKAAIRSDLQHFRSQELPVGRPAWFAHDWQGEADGWIDSRLPSLGLRRTGPSEIVKFWSLSAVLRIPVTASAEHGAERSLYFKAACQLFHAEAAVTAELARLAPKHVPDVLAIDPDRGWMLMNPLPGEPPARLSPEAAPTAGRMLAELHMITSDHIPCLVAAGAVDRTLQPTLAGLSMIINDSLERDQLTDTERDLARQMEPWLAEQLTAVAESGLPYTITHGDLHPGNIAQHEDTLVIYDWTDAAVSFPTLDAVLLASSIPDDHRDATVVGYVDRWRERFPSVDFEALREPSIIANEIYQAISYERIYRTQEPRTRWEMGGVVAGVLRGLGQRWLESAAR